MRDGDLSAFMELFGKMASVYGKKANEDLAPTYFRILQPFDFVNVARAADRLMGRCKFFPKPAEWAEAVSEVPGGDPLDPLAGDEAKVWLDAEQRRFEADPCSCGECVAADVTEKPLRFVPNIDRWDNTEKRLLGQREVLRGHWAHGVELARWYRARADFVEVGLRVQLRQPLDGTVADLAHVQRQQLAHLFGIAEKRRAA